MAALTFWATLTATEGRSVDTEWEAFFARLDSIGRAPFKGQLEHPGWSPIRAEPPLRADANVVALSALVLDYDGTHTLEDALDLWRPFYGYVHTTRRHTPQVHRFRVILPLSREITPKEHALLWQFVVTTSNHHVDLKTKDPSRFWYLPGGGESFVSHRLPGAVLDPEPMLVAARELAEEPPPVATRIHPNADTRADKYAMSALEKACADARTAAKGERNNKLFVAASTAGNFIAAGLLDEGFAHDCLEDAARAAGLSRFEARKTIRSGIAKGKRSPRQVPQDEREEGSRYRAPPAGHPPPPSDKGGPTAAPDAEGAPEADSAPKTPKYRTLAEFARTALKPVGQRLETGFATLDTATRGGIPLGKVVVLAGAPGAAKTTLATFLANCWEKSGCAVVYLAADEPADGIAIRFGQLAGFSRDGLEAEGDIGDATRAGFAAHSEGRALVVLDPDENGEASTIEAANAALGDFAGDRPRILVVDSLQTALCDAAQTVENAKERIDIKLAVIKAIAKRGTLVIAISEMARSGYRSNDRQENISALAAGKDSGSIEYGGTLLLGLRSVRGEHGQIDVEVPKNRLGGPKPDFRIQLDFDRASFREISLPGEMDESTGAASNDNAQRRLERAKERVRECLRKHTDLKSQREVLAHANGSRDANRDALSDMEKCGEVIRVGGVFRIHEGNQ